MSRLIGRIVAASCIFAAISISGTAAAQDDEKMALGKEVFLEKSQPQCALCHTLANAEAVGEVGPNLDELKPDAARVAAAVINGIGPMPENEILSQEEIDAVALYVSTVTGGSQ